MAWKNKEARRIYHTKYMRERYQNDPIHRMKQLARVKTQYVKRINNCELCGSSKTEAHHPDYNHPEIRQWLCRDCHLKIHLG